MADIAHTINSLWNFCDRARARIGAEPSMMLKTIRNTQLLHIWCFFHAEILSICLLPPSLEVLFCVFSLLRRCTSHTHARITTRSSIIAVRRFDTSRFFCSRLRWVSAAHVFIFRMYFVIGADEDKQ